MEWPPNAARIPDEMAYAQRGKVFTLIPRRKPGHGTVTLVLPNFLANPPRFLGGKAGSRRIHLGKSEIERQSHGEK